MGDTNVKLIISAVDKASKVFGDVTDSVKKSEKQMQQLGTIWKGTAAIATTAMATFAAVGVVLKKTFDFGKAGATVIQTRESFQMLMKTVGAAPDQLERLRAAAGGTIDELTLMSSTSLLLAGVQGELATRLVDSSDEILNIAKAANKLNPSLGTTSFMYESLMTGLKRGQKLIIDNTGLTLDINSANEKYAKSLGKSALALTEDEKKMALINATMEAGKVLINQVGGNTDSATDAFGRFEAAAKNAGDAMKEAFTPAATDMAEIMTVAAGKFQDFWEESSKTEKGLKQLGDLMKAGAITSNDYAALWVRMRLGVFNLDEALADLNREQQEYNATLPKIITGYNGYRSAIEDTTESVGLNLLESRKLGEYMRDQFVPILNETEGAGSRMAASIIEITNAAFGNMIIDELHQLYTDGIIEMDEYRTLAGGVMEDMLGMKGAAIEAAFGVLDLKTKLADGALSAADFVTQGQALLDLLEKISGTDWDVTATVTYQAFNLPSQAYDKPTPVPSPNYVPPKVKPIEKARGMDAYIPSGYPNDSYYLPLAVTSGERVQVTPAGKSSGGDTFNINISATGDGSALYRQFRQALDADLRARRNAGIQYAGL